MEKANSVVDVIIIGGGLAGLTSAIHLGKFGFDVLLIEKNTYPKHKVCGEYVSNEVLPYLAFLQIDVFKLGAKKISRFELTTQNNKSVSAKLPLGGFGVSRYTLDSALAQKAMEEGVNILQDTVVGVQFNDEEFKVTTKSKTTYRSRIVIGAHGKRSGLDQSLNRGFIKNKSPFLAVKRHVKGDFPDDLVGLHNFTGGYCGVSKVENDYINVCYITDFKNFKKYKDIGDFQEKVVFQNKKLKSIFQNSSPVFKEPLTISQISFETKEPVENHIIMCGDSAGMIHPLCGNGMGMAIRSAQIASQLIIDYLQGKIADRSSLESEYRHQWNKAFKNRLRMGHFVANLFKGNRRLEIVVGLLKIFPWMLPIFIKQTHGKPMRIK